MNVSVSTLNEVGWYLLARYFRSLRPRAVTRLSTPTVRIRLP